MSYDPHSVEPGDLVCILCGDGAGELARVTSVTYDHWKPRRIKYCQVDFMASGGSRRVAIGDYNLVERRAAAKPGETVELGPNERAVLVTAPPVTVAMPLALTPEMIKAVRTHPTTMTTDITEEHRRVGWLLDAWDVLVGYQGATR